MMKSIIRSGGVIILMVTVVSIDVAVGAVLHSKGRADASREGTKEIVVTIGSVSSTEKAMAFAEADSLYRVHKFDEAVVEYRKAVAGGGSSELEAQAQYQIGLCYYLLGDGHQAEEEWQTVLRTYPTAGTPAAWASYGVAVLETDRNNFHAAIARLQEIVQEGAAQDEEVYAFSYYQIGRIYMAFLHDQAQAGAAFQEVLRRYPESTPAKRHLWLD